MINKIIVQYRSFRFYPRSFRGICKTHFTFTFPGIICYMDYSLLVFEKKKTFNRNSVNSIIRPTAFWYWRQLCVWSCVDYSKAFDLINHKLLITKVRAYDIEIGLLDKMRTYLPIDLFSLYVLFSQNRSCDNTLENCFFQIPSYSRAYVQICTHNSRKNKKSSSPGTSIG